VGSTLLISSLFLVGALGVSWWARKQAVQAQVQATAAEVPVSQLIEDTGSIAQELGPGSFRMMVRIRGKIVCSTPLLAELSQTPCVSYGFTVTRESEEVLWGVDHEGHQVQRVQRRSEVVTSNEASTSFELDDGTGRILVYPDHAKVERIKTYAGFQPSAPGVGLNVGSFVLNLAARPGGTIGYRFEEHALPVGQEVTVVAEAGDSGGQLALRGPEAGGTPLVLSLQSFADLTQKNQWTVSVLRGLSIGLAAVAVLIFLLGVVR